MKVPPQIVRLLIVTVVLVGSYFVAKSLLTPPTFGELGWYRAAALEELAQHKLTYAGKQECEVCHDDIWQMFHAGKHQTLSCEGCHGPAMKHVDDPENEHLLKPGSDQCLRCHQQNPSRPDWYTQIDPEEHLEGECIECHIPHNPTEMPEEEEASSEQ